MLGRLFQTDPDLRLSGTEIYLDSTEPRPIGVVTHGHADHTAVHERTIATPATAAIVRKRLGSFSGDELQYDEWIGLDPFRVRFHPAGHVLGSAMVEIDSGQGRVLYTGDFKLRESLTSETARVPAVDAVITEATYGDPKWEFPSLEEMSEMLVATARGSIEKGLVPVILAYSLGKAQEATAILTRGGIPVAQHPVVAGISQIYERFGVDLGDWAVWRRQETFSGVGPRSVSDLEGSALVIPAHLWKKLRKSFRYETILLTGHVLHDRGFRRANHEIPLSDHADFPQLLELIERSEAREVYVTHGSAKTARELRKLGIRAEFLRRRPQMRLF